MKDLGYLVSIVSVILLALPAWKNASQEPLLFAALIAGMAASILGMALRWASYRREKAGQGGTS